MTTTKSESPAHQEKKGEKMKNSAENKKEEEVELKPSKKKEQHYYPVSKPPSAPTLQDSFNISHNHTQQFQITNKITEKMQSQNLLDVTSQTNMNK